MSKPERVRVESLKGTIALIVRLPRPMHAALLAEKKRTGRTLNVIARSALAVWLKRGGKRED